MNTESKHHIGRKIGRIRELRGLKQDALANSLGISQQTVSNIENSETIDDARLEEIATALGVTADGIKQFSEEAVINYLINFNDQSSGFNTNCTFNPIEKIVELYERLVQAEREKVSLLEKILKK